MIHASLGKLAVPVDSLSPMSGNPRIGDVDAVAASLDRFGQRKPIVVRASDRTIVAGNHTWKAAQQLGWIEIAALLVDDDEATAQAFALADNRTAEIGVYDEELLLELIRSVGAADPSLVLDAGWDVESVQDLVNRIEPPTTPDVKDELDDEQPAPPADPITKRGDIWTLGQHRIMCGDSRDADDVKLLLNGSQINVAFTSPPYASQRTYDESSGFKPIPPDNYVDWFASVAENVKTHLASDGSWFVNIKEHCEDGQRVLYVRDLTIAHVRSWSWNFVDEFAWTRNSVPGGWPNRFKNAWEPVFHFSASSGIKFRPDSVMIPTDDAFTYSPDNPKSKTGFFSNRGRPDIAAPGMARPSNVLRIGAETQLTDLHSAPFPVALPSWFIRAYSDPTDVIYDPFMGSGSTLLAAHQNDRVSYGMEISPGYVDVICARFQRHTGIIPVLESTSQPHDFTKD